MSEKLSKLERVLQERGEVSFGVASPNNTDEFRRFKITLSSDVCILTHDECIIASMKKFSAKRLYAGEVQEGKVWAGRPTGPMAADFYADFSAILSALDGVELRGLVQIIRDDPEQEGEGFSA